MEKKKQILNKLIEDLFNAPNNTIMLTRWIENAVEIQEILRTKSIHKNTVKWIIHTDNAWYLWVQITDLWVRYFENWFRFDYEIQKEQQISSTINIWDNFTGSFAIWNNITQNVQIINNEIDKIIEILGKKDIINKDEVIDLLNEFKQTQDKWKLTKAIEMLWNVSTIISILSQIVLNI